MITLKNNALFYDGSIIPRSKLDAFQSEILGMIAEARGGMKIHDLPPHAVIECEEGIFRHTSSNKWIRIDGSRSILGPQHLQDKEFKILFFGIEEK